MPLRVDDLPIDERLKRIIIEKKGIRELYPPQEEAIRAGLLEGQNLVLATSTATGKTFLAELTLVNSVLKKRGKAVLLVPLKALAYEKSQDLKIYEELGVKVAVTTGEYDSQDMWLEQYDIIVATYEKFDSLLRHRVKWLNKISTLIIDEIHYISDEKRGPIIESIIAKLRMLKLNMQIVALSATIENAEEIAEWLNAKLVKSDWRPVKLREGVYFDGKIIFADGEERHIKKLKDPVIDLVIDCLEEDGQVLIFTNSRTNTVKLANSIAQFIANYSKKLVDSNELQRICSKIEEVSSSKLIAEELRRVVRYGVAFHHAGLEHEVRRILEDAYRTRKIKVVVATTTLAAGVNLPARRVIIHEYRRYEPGVGYEPIPVAEYKQMAGRAGRPRLDPYGEAVLIARRETEVNYLLDYYIRSSPEPVVSKFLHDKNLYTHILAAVASSYANSIDDLCKFIQHTLAVKQRPMLPLYTKLLRDKIVQIVKFLEESGFVSVNDNGTIKPTRLGTIVNLNYIDPLTASIYIRGLRARESASDMAYLCLLVKSSEVPKLHIRRNEVERYINILKSIYNELLLKPVDSVEELEELSEGELVSLLEEIKTACMLYDWINESPEDILVMKYEVGPGDIRMYAETLEWLCHALAQLAHALEMHEHARMLEILKWRIRYGVKTELVELVQIEGVGRARARALYDAGFRTIEDLASATPQLLASKVRGIGEKLAKLIIESAKEKLRSGNYVKVTKTDIDQESKRQPPKVSTQVTRQRSILDFLM